MEDKNRKLSKLSRLKSLDAYRGFVIAGMLLGNKGTGNINIPVLNIIFNQFKHTDWIGIRFIDLVFPSFLFIVGVAMPFSFAKRKEIGQSYNKLLFHVIKRAVILFLLGSVIMSFDVNSPTLFEWSSALQPIGFAYIIAFLLLNKSIIFRATLTGIIIITYWIILGLIPAPGIPAGTLEKNHNLVFYIDNLLLREAHPDGWGTLLLFFPQIANTLSGTIVGDIFRKDKSSVIKIKLIALISASCLFIGIIMSFYIPIIMKIWSPSYTVFTIGISSLLMLIFYSLIDLQGYQKWSSFLTVFGMNALSLYVFHRIFESNIASIINIFISGLVEIFGQAGPALQIVVVIFIEWLILYWMYKREIFIKL